MRPKIQDARADRMRELLSVLNPTRLEIVNNSARHGGHAGDDGSGQTHYRVDIAAPALVGLARVVAHRQVLDLLAPEFATGLHAVELDINP